MEIFVPWVFWTSHIIIINPSKYLILLVAAVHLQKDWHLYLLYLNTATDE